ncbi:MAG: MATE family efflux transporter [Pelagibacteraceae bacterium]|nr:MATE family efflux transporter [Pelagibacteraceae bacterium]MBT4952346.1 MATE family efflux transporter [Pelagibacteraceae bacterium]MBT5214303.1 MATE family efflux transporter [Pelagibacteraceae bacterium]MBT6198345.1 MATE family efflux transporter [Pelagibacteraceae bacterium]
MSLKKIDLKKDSIYSLFIKIAVPSSIGTIFQNLYSIVDSIFAGQMISESALAAIGQIFPIYFVIIALGIGLSIGTTSLIANSIGESNLENSGKIFSQSFILSILVSIIITIVGINISPSIINSINNDKETLELSIKYINIIFFGSIFIFILMSINSSLSAQGDTKSYRNVLIFSFFLNIILNPILISGKILSFQIISPLGIEGIAYATIISQFVGIFYLFIKLSKTRIFKYVQLTIIPNLKIISNILSQGIPASIGMMMIAVGSYLLIYFVGIFGVEAIAGYTSAGRYEQLFFLPLLGLSTATVSIVGQNFGAKQYQRVLETYKKGIRIGVIVLTFLGLIIFLSAEIAMNLFTDNANVKQYGSDYLKISALMFPAFPFFFIGNATFQGLKRAIIVMYMAIMRFVLMPFIMISIIFYQIGENYNLIFFSLVAMHWIIGLSYYYYCNKKYKTILN